MVRPPVTFRDTVLLFGQLRENELAEELFARVDWSGVSARQLVHAFLDRAPRAGWELAEPAGFSPADWALTLFQSPAFRDGLPGRILRHFPGKQRLLFVHIPKSAGTDFIAAMNRSFPAISNQLSDAGLVSDTQLARRLGNLARKTGDASRMFMSGHVKLDTYLDEGMFRFKDRLMAIVRDPDEICVSFANYVTSRFAACPDLSAQDTQVWASLLGLTAADIAQIEPRALALGIVTKPGLQTSNPICSLLGDGTASSVLANLQRADIEITSRARYGDWLRQVWNLKWDQRANSSRQLIGWADLAGWQQARIKAGNTEDRIVFEAVEACLNQSGAVSVSGLEVAKALRPQIELQKD